MTLPRLLTDKRSKFPGCVEVPCRADYTHRPCHLCGSVTDGSTVIVEPETLRRRKAFLCRHCQLKPAFREQQAALRDQRRAKDWKQITDPIQAGDLSERMTEQFKSRVRKILRAFAASDMRVATVDDIQPGTLNQSILSLGLSAVMYAEQRGTETVLRKVGKP